MDVWNFHCANVLPEVTGVYVTLAHGMPFHVPIYNEIHRQDGSIPLISVMDT
jgi:hypothetical protein